MTWQSRDRKTSRRRRRAQSKAASHAVRLTRAAYRLGADVKIEPTRYAIRIAGEHVGTVSGKTAALLRAFGRNVDALDRPEGLASLDHWALVRLAEDLGHDYDRVQPMTKRKLLALLKREGLPDLSRAPEGDE